MQVWVSETPRSFPFVDFMLFRRLRNGACTPVGSVSFRTRKSSVAGATRMPMHETEKSPLPAFGSNNILYSRKV